MTIMLLTLLKNIQIILYDFVENAFLQNAYFRFIHSYNPNITEKNNNI